jgi:hypothetical protein
MLFFLDLPHKYLSQADNGLDLLLDPTRLLFFPDFRGQEQTLNHVNGCAQEFLDVVLSAVAAADAQGSLGKVHPSLSQHAQHPRHLETP